MEYEVSGICPDYGPEEETAIVFLDEGSLQAWSDEHCEPYGDEHEIPELDFDGNEVAFYSWGRKGSGSYAIRVEAVTQTEANRTLELVRVTPGCLFTMDVKYTQVAVVLPRGQGPVVMRIRDTTGPPCS